MNNKVKKGKLNLNKKIKAQKMFFNSYLFRFNLFIRNIRNKKKRELEIDLLCLIEKFAYP